jgi:hypothetical protein
VRLQARSIEKFVIASREAEDWRVFYYQRPEDGQPFVLGLTSKPLLQRAAELGHGRAMLMDATFGMHHLKVRIYPLPVKGSALLGSALLAIQTSVLWWKCSMRCL